MKVGVLGGTFDPVHFGHLAIAEEVRTNLNLDEVIFLVTGQPWMKQGKEISPAAHRVNMIKLAIKGKPYYRVSTLEIERTGPTYSVDTISLLIKQIGTEVELFFIMGWDSLAGLPKWREPEKLIKMCTLVAVPRPGYSAPDIKELDKVIPGLSKWVIMLDKPLIPISATEIKEHVRHGLPVSQLVPEAVERYIREHKLYIMG